MFKPVFTKWFSRNFILNTICHDLLRLKLDKYKQIKSGIFLFGPKFEMSDLPNQLAKRGGGNWSTSLPPTTTTMAGVKKILKI